MTPDKAPQRPSDASQLERLEELLLASELETLTTSEEQELREILNGSQEAQQLFARWQVQSYLLNEAQSQAQLETSSELKKPIDQSTSELAPAQHRATPTTALSWKKWLALAASLLILGLSSRLMYLEFRQSHLRIPASDNNSANAADAAGSRSERNALEAKSSGIALVTRAVGIEVTGDSQRIVRGEALNSGTISLTAGIAQIEFYCGATVVVEGPAVLELLTDKMISCRQGKLRAQVPPAARGFEVVLNNRRIVDLGTEFGVEIDGDEGSLEVFDGEVELHGKVNNQPPTKLLAGNSASWNSGSVKFDNVVHESFLDIDTLQEQEKERASANFIRWRSHSLKLRNSPDLIAYYAMDENSAWKRKLPSTLPNSDLDGALVGAKVRRGRWDQKRSIEFKHPGDRVRVRIPGQFSSLTFCCWVRIDSLDRWYNSLFLTDSYERGEPHWQILDTGQLFFSVRVSKVRGGPEHQEVLSPVFWTPSMSGKWIHLATTYDTDRSETAHYLNGEELSRETLRPEKLVKETRIGLASIGNWSSPTKPDEEFAIRNLNGRMDELMIFSKALSPNDILELYEKGKP